MKTIGMIGGMSWESSAVYYKIINQKVKELPGGFHSCKSILYSVDFAKVQQLQHDGQWDVLCKMMAEAAMTLEKACAGIVILCTNTMHLCSDAIEKSINIPFLHIPRTTSMEIGKRGLQKVALPGTNFTMEKAFYKDILEKEFGMKVIIPLADDKDTVHRVIYNELVRGMIKDASRVEYKRIIANLEKEGAEGAVLGCTEIPLLIRQVDVNIPVFDTTRIHAEKAVELAME